jgi:hypothetical protein
MRFFVLFFLFCVHVCCVRVYSFTRSITHSLTHSLTHHNSAFLHGDVLIEVLHQSKKGLRGAEPLVAFAFHTAFILKNSLMLR